MNGREILKKGKHSSKTFTIIYCICIFVIIATFFYAAYKLGNETPEATNFTENGAVGMEPDKYVYMKVDGLSDLIATYGPSESEYTDENEKYYIAISDGYWYIVNLDNETLNKLKEIQSFTFGEIENQPESVTIYGMTEEVPQELKQIAIDIYNEGLTEEEQMSIEEFDQCYGSVLLNVRKTPEDLTVETLIIGICIIVFGITVIAHICDKIIRLRVYKYLKKNEYLEDLSKQLDDDVEEKFFNDRVIFTKDYFVDTYKSEFCAVKYSDIKWIHTHIVKYNGIITVSNSIILHMKDGKTNFQCLTAKGTIKQEFENVFSKLCEKMPADSLKGYTRENIKEFKNYKKELKNNVL